MRVAAYLRVSTIEQADGYSLMAQRQAIEAYCRTRGWSDITWFEDAGKSGHADDVSRRPAFARLLQDAEAGNFGVVVVHKLDRWARSVVVALQTLKQLERHNVAWVSLGENLDFTGPFGRAMLGILAVFAQLYSDNLSAEVRKGLGEKKRQGLHVGGIPYGARRVAGRLVPDPTTAPILREILTRAPAESDYRIARDLNARGVPAPRKGEWRPTTISDMRQAGTAWLDKQGEEWAALAQSARGRPPQPRARRGTTVRLLSGLLRCGCGGAMGYGTGRDDPATGVRRHWPECLGRRQRRGSCRRRFRPMAYYEALVERWLLSLPDPADDDEELAGDDARRAELAEDRRRAGVRYEARELTDAEYHARLAALAKEEAQLPPAPVRRREIGRGLVTAQREWATFSPAERNLFLRQLIRAVVIDGDTLAIVPRDETAWLLGRHDQVL